MCVTKMDGTARTAIWRMLASDSVSQLRRESCQLEIKAQKGPGTRPGSPWCWAATRLLRLAGSGHLCLPRLRAGEGVGEEGACAGGWGRGGRRQRGCGTRWSRPLGAPWREAGAQPGGLLWDYPGPRLIAHTGPSAPPKCLTPSPPSPAPASSQAPALPTPTGLQRGLKSRQQEAPSSRGEASI